MDIIYLVIKLIPSLNYDSKDPNYTLLSVIFKIIDSKKFGTVKMLALDFVFQSIHFFEALSG